MIEMHDVLDEFGNKTGEQKTKDEMFKNGDWRQVVHLWIIDSGNKILIQKRTDNKGTFGGMWDPSVGGGVAAGESTLEACVRETKEELGIDIKPNDVKLISRHKMPKIIPETGLPSNDFSDTYIIKMDIGLEDLVLQKSEVAEIKKLSYEELKDEFENENKFKNWVPHGIDYYFSVLDSIKTVVV
jgi:isopentenyldiphosphate isomerase